MTVYYVQCTMQRWQIREAGRECWLFVVVVRSVAWLPDWLYCTGYKMHCDVTGSCNSAVADNITELVSAISEQWPDGVDIYDNNTNLWDVRVHEIGYVISSYAKVLLLYIHSLSA